MVLSRRLEHPRLVVATLTGVVTSRDQAELLGFVRSAIVAAGSVIVMLRLESFAGWNPDALLDNETIWLRDDEGVARIAIVGDPQWKAAVLTLMAQPIRTIPIAYFDTEAAARHWLGLDAHPARRSA